MVVRITIRAVAHVQRWPAAGSSLDRQKIAASPAISAIDQRPRRNAWLRSWHEARAASPQRRSSNANGLCGQNSAGSVRPFKEIFCDDISEFESHMPSHAVGL